MTTYTPVLATVGVIARRLNQPVHRVEYVIRTRDIKPAGVAGNSRVFAENAVQSIAGEVRRIDQERERGRD